MTLLADMWTILKLMLVPGAFQAALDQAFSFEAWMED